MPNLPQKKLTKADLAAIIFLTALTLALFFGLRRPAELSGTLTVTTESGSETHPLSEAAVYLVESAGYTLTVTVQDGAAAVTSSDCPDHICEHTGAVSRPGQTIACVPARVVIRVDSPESDPEGGGNDADFIIG